MKSCSKYMGTEMNGDERTTVWREDKQEAVAGQSDEGHGCGAHRRRL